MNLLLSLLLKAGTSGQSIPPAAMFVGDSIIEGFNATNTTGLRGDTSFYINLDGLNVDLVGQFQTSAGFIPDPDHAAQSGASSGTILTNFQNALIGPPVRSPALAIVDMGINDVANSGIPGVTAAAQNFTRMQTMQNLGMANNPAFRIIYMNLLPLPPGDTYEAQVPLYNNEWSKVGGYKDQFNAIYPANQLAIFDIYAAIGGAYDNTLMGGNRLHPAEAGWLVVRPAFLSQFRARFRNMATAINALSVAITSPSPGATLTVGVPATISGTVSRAKQDMQVTPKKGATALPVATQDQYSSAWTTSYTPVSGDVGTLVLGADALDIFNNLDSASAPTVSVTVQAAAPSDPLAIITSKTARFFVRADTVVEGGGAGTGVTSWTDLSGAGKHFTQGGAANLRPTLNASVAAFNNQPTVGFDGVDDWLVSAIDLPAPGTSPTWFWMIFRQRAWTSGRPVFGINSTNCYVRAIVATPQLFAQWGTLSASNSGATLNTAARLKMLINNATSDYFRCGATNVTGTNLGNTDAAANLGLGAYANGTSPSNIEVAEFGAWNGEPTAGELSNMEAYAVTRYGAGLLV